MIGGSWIQRTIFKVHIFCLKFILKVGSGVRPADAAG